MSTGSGFVVQAGDSNTPVHHALTILRDAINWTFWDRMGLIGKPSSGKPIILDTMLKGKKGEDVSYHFTPFADKGMILNESVAPEGNEAAFQEFINTVRINSVDRPFRVDGDMTNQRTILNGRKEMRGQIAQHFADFNDVRIFEELSGMGLLETPATHQAAADTTNRVFGENRIIRASGGNSFAVVSSTVASNLSDNTALNSAMTSSDKNSPLLWKRASIMATKRTTNTPYRMQAIRSQAGKDFFIGVMSKNAAYDLSLHPDWFTRSITTSMAGINNDPWATGSLGVIDNIALHQADNVVEFIDAADSTLRFARNLLIGQNATLLGFAKTLTYVERLFNYNKSLGVNGSELRGEQKLSFTSKDDATQTIDYGVAQVITASN